MTLVSRLIMKNYKNLARPVATLTIALLAAGCNRAQTDSDAVVADTVYTNGKIYTVNEAQPWAEAVAVKDGKFIAVGSTDDALAMSGDDTVTVDLGGKFVMPGIFDLHTHPFITPWYGSMNLSLQNSGDADAIIAEIKAYADSNPDKE